jgi:hypothetical protein
LTGYDGAIAGLLIEYMSAFIVVFPLVIGLSLEHRHKVLCAGKEKDVRLFGIPILREAFVCFSSDGRE